MDGIAWRYEDETQKGDVEEVEDRGVEDVEDPRGSVGGWLGGADDGVVDFRGFCHGEDGRNSVSLRGGLLYH